VIIVTDSATELTILQQQAQAQHEIQDAITTMFAPEDEGLLFALREASLAGLPEIQISPIQGKLLQLLATMCNAQKILEIGALAGYSGIWLARALPPGGHLITLEMSPKHADVVKNPLPGQALATVLKYVLVRRSTCFLSLPMKRLLIWFLSMQIRLLTRNTWIGPYAILELGVSL
jgi:hypothetical protein